MLHRRLASGYTLRALRPEDHLAVLASWQGAFTETEAAFSRLCSVLPSLAAYRSRGGSVEAHRLSQASENCDDKAYRIKQISHSSDKDGVNQASEGLDEQLAAFAVVNQNGEIGKTYTFAGHRRLGLAKAITWQLTKDLKERNYTPMVSIADPNKASLDLHQQLGYKCISRATLMFFTPSGFNIDVLNFDENVLPRKKLTKPI